MLDILTRGAADTYITGFCHVALVRDAAFPSMGQDLEEEST